jgi:hypothetical protein
MRVFKTKEFARFARSEGISDGSLCDAISRAERGLVDADLGGGLIKQRVARQGQGRSGGYRTLIAFRSKVRSVFVYGFAKNERDNIGKRELAFWRDTAFAALAMTDKQVAALMTSKDLTEVFCDD